jgi:hypothetical protein
VSSNAQKIGKLLRNFGKKSTPIVYPYRVLHRNIIRFSGNTFFNTNAPIHTTTDFEVKDSFCFFLVGYVQVKNNTRLYVQNEERMNTDLFRVKGSRTERFRRVVYGLATGLSSFDRQSRY